MLYLILADIDGLDFDGEKLLSSNELSYLSTVKLEKRKKEFIASHSLLRMIRREILGFENEEMFYNEYGKPSLTHLEFDFSISHTEGFVALLISDIPNVKIGVDIQKKFSNIKAEKRVEERFLKNKEFLLLKSGEIDLTARVYSNGKLDTVELAEKKKEDFLYFWTRLEAILKMSGEGFSKLGDIHTVKAWVKSYEFFDYTVSVAIEK